MRILFLTHRLPYPPNRGDRIRAYYLLREMSALADVTLFSLVHDAVEESQAGAVPFAQKVITARVTRVRNLIRGSALLASRHPLTHALLDAPNAKGQLARHVAASRPDVVVAYCSSMARFALEPPLSDLPLVLDMVDVDSVKWAHFARRARGLRRWIYQREARTLRAFEIAATKHAKATLVVNEQERGMLLELGVNGCVQIMPNHLDADAYRPPRPPGPSTTVTFSGVMSYQPNEEAVQWFARHVWPLVRSARPDARFCVVGANPTRRLRRLAAQDQSIEVTGSVPTVQPYLWRSAVAVAPLQAARGIQTKVLEALAAGVPVVTTPVVMRGLPREIHAGCLVAAEPHEFADAVLRLLAESPEARLRRAQAIDLTYFTCPTRSESLGGILKNAAGIRVPSTPEASAHQTCQLPSDDCATQRQ